MGGSHLEISAINDVATNPWPWARTSPGSLFQLAFFDPSVAGRLNGDVLVAFRGEEVEMLELDLQPALRFFAVFWRLAASSSEPDGR
jgi:hypothetical protein